VSSETTIVDAYAEGCSAVEVLIPGIQEQGPVPRYGRLDPVACLLSHRYAAYHVVVVKPEMFPQALG
jgi:hypothetical protein